MILNTKINYNNYKEKVIENFIWFNIPCPTCKTTGNFIRHAKYPRNLCVLEGENFNEVRVTIQRVYCKYCEHTHAILPIEVIPYCYYSVSCVLKILSKYYLEDDTIEEIVDEYDITQKLVYILIGKFIAFSKYIIDFLRILFDIDLSYEISIKTLLEEFLAKFKDCSIIKSFFDHSKKVLLMTRSQYNLSNKLYIGVYD